ncbi:hypothetical protein [Clostridium sp. DMHC 10]|nr:hypothetical protein [Clostridium sp. DMHC 10]
MSIVSSIGRSIIGGFNSAISFITSLPSRALQWGRDFISGLINGIESKVGSIVNAVSGIADTITSYLHFSVPDVGPLKKYESWMPDFMYGLASGINANKDIVTNAINGLSTDMSIGVKTASIQQPTLSMVGSNSTSKPNANSSIEEFKKAIIEAIIEALKELKQNDNGKSSNNNGNSNGDLIFKISDTEFGRIAIAAINKVQRQAGVTLLKV